MKLTAVYQCEDKKCYHYNESLFSNFLIVQFFIYKDFFYFHIKKFTYFLLLLAPRAFFMQNLIDSARTWINTPWQHNQRIKGIGVDCVNFLSAIAHESGLNIEEIPESYGRTAIDNQIEEYLKRNFTLKNSLEIEENNIILYTFSGYKNHVALATSPTTIIHANSRVGKVVEHQIDGIWLKFIASIWVIIP